MSKSDHDTYKQASHTIPATSIASVSVTVPRFVRIIRISSLARHLLSADFYLEITRGVRPPSRRQGRVRFAPSFAKPLFLFDFLLSSFKATCRSHRSPIGSAGAIGWHNSIADSGLHCGVPSAPPRAATRVPRPRGRSVEALCCFMRPSRSYGGIMLCAPRRPFRS
jgi:hypothetical protein